MQFRVERFSKSFEPQCGKVAKRCKNDPLKILAQSEGFEGAQCHFILVKESYENK